VVKLVLVSRILLGLIFLSAGINGLVVFFGFSPIFPTSPKAMELFRFKYLDREIHRGPLRLVTSFQSVTLAINMLAPLVVNILLFHIFVDPSLLPLGLLVTRTRKLSVVEVPGKFPGIVEPRVKKQPSKKKRYHHLTSWNSDNGGPGVFRWVITRPAPTQKRRDPFVTRGAAFFLLEGVSYLTSTADMQNPRRYPLW
jgi:hypothetical protein